MYRRVYVLLLSASAGAVVTTCSPKESLPVSVGYRLIGAVFDTLLTPGIVTCARECLGRTACQGFNFNLDHGICELSSANDGSTGVSMMAETSFVLSKAEDWPSRILGTCEHHSCPVTTRCVEETDGPECVISYCQDPPTVEFATLTSVGPLTPVAESLPYECTVGYVPCGIITCNTDGTWSPMTCMPVSNCTDVLQLRSTYTDGEYWLYPLKLNGARVRVYCHAMDSTPSEYISLKTPYFMNAPLMQNPDCTGESPKTHNLLGYHEYTKFGLDITNMAINKKARAFYNKTGVTNANVAVVRDCYSAAGSACGPKGQAVMDLRGTGLALDESITWSRAYGTSIWDPIVNRFHSHQLIEIRCGGVCGVCSAPGLVLLALLDSDGR
ncbi:uncharacterized protein LOC124262738 [Haliotis rubra]|uniref:uncharacterized protein LOC124262738 n=1 Tax=Haliotis rubra TaxID=36100 RepID=UPI001EE4EB59|nr:uncharacterized protein LOC124262738 [Haliotis rubra]